MSDGFGPSASGSFGAPSGGGFGGPSSGGGFGAPGGGGGFGAPPGGGAPSAGGGPPPGGGSAPPTGGGFGAPAGGGFGAPYPAGVAAPPQPVLEQEGFGGEGFIGGPSLPMLLAPLGVALLAIVIALLFGGDMLVAVMSWVLAGPLATLLLALFVRHDTDQRARPAYGEPSWLRVLHPAVMVAIVFAVGVSAYRIAEVASS